MQNIELETFNLSAGNHANPEVGMCAMEMVAYLAREPHSDHPQCACPALTSYVMTLNDRFNNEERQLLKPFLPRLIGTRDENALKRAKVLAHAALTVFAPLALRARGFEAHAAKLEAVKFGDWQEGRKLARDAAAAADADAADAAAYAADAAAYAAADAADAAADAAAYAAYADAADAAAYAAAVKDARRKVVDAALSALNDALNVGKDKE